MRLITVLAVLATVMYCSRNIDWNNFSKPSREVKGVTPFDI
jgi:inner membrane protein involved in colicin E2 resistance